MKAIVVNEFGPPEVMQLVDVATPQPTGTQVLVKVEAIGVNPVETYIRSGTYPSVPPLPYTPGKDAAGVVEAVGQDVTRWKAGDRVYTANSISGAYAKYTLVDEQDLGLLPDDTSFEQGAGIWTPYATSFRALFQRAKAQAGETVLIHGASGGVGIAAVQWAKNAGLTVIGTASTESGRQLAQEQGADKVFDHSEDGYLVRIKDATGGVDVIIEMLANVNLVKDFDVLKMFGRICVVGNRGSLDFNPRLIMGKDATVTGMALFNAPREAFDEIHREIYSGLTAGYLRPIVSRQFPLEEAAAAHHAVIEDKALGKIVLIP
ncbi:MAG TPA: NADPH:quinone reductase [Pyrinomonadaceae bacterium]|jgi:NADPH2:quinone reductase|nr:NADPH:quinone reductase [Pyrinomonadaceae bacterium]